MTKKLPNRRTEASPINPWRMLLLPRRRTYCQKLYKEKARAGQKSTAGETDQAVASETSEDRRTSLSKECRS
jgi:hypothetical protein